VAAIVAAVYFLGNDLTGVGFADDIPGLAIITKLVEFALKQFAR
jgi:hypothetical protein